MIAQKEKPALCWRSIRHVLLNAIGTTSDSHLLFLLATSCKILEYTSAGFAHIHDENNL